MIAKNHQNKGSQQVNPRFKRLQILIVSVTSETSTSPVRVCVGAKEEELPVCEKVKMCFWSVRPAGRTERSLKHAIHIQYSILDNGVPCQQ